MKVILAELTDDEWLELSEALNRVRSELSVRSLNENPIYISRKLNRVESIIKKLFPRKEEGCTQGEMRGMEL